MQKFSVQGMSCAACSSRVENAVSKIDGVTACNVSLLTNSMTVEGKFNSNDIILAVKNAGYTANLYGSTNTDKPLKDNEITKLKARLISSLFFLIILNASGVNLNS